MADDFVTWIPNNIKSSIIVVPPEGTPMSGTFVANTTAIKGMIYQHITLSIHFCVTTQNRIIICHY